MDLVRERGTTFIFITALHALSFMTHFLPGWALIFEEISPSPSLFQVNLCYLCQACTSLLHSRKMLQHYLQVRMGTLRLKVGSIVCSCFMLKGKCYSVSRLCSQCDYQQSSIARICIFPHQKCLQIVVETVKGQT